MLKPYPLSEARLENAVLAEDRKRCRKIGPCGIGEKALYLNSFFIDRRYYVPFSAVTRVYKRVAMSRGGFTGKGIFASMAYLVVEFEGGRQKACNFKYEAQVDEFLSAMRAAHPSIPCVSEAAEQRIAEEKARREEEERRRPPMSEAAEKTVHLLDNAIDYLDERPRADRAPEHGGKAPPQLSVHERQLPLGGDGDYHARLYRARFRHLRLHAA